MYPLDIGYASYVRGLPCEVRIGGFGFSLAAGNGVGALSPIVIWLAAHGREPPLRVTVLDGLAPLRRHDPRR